LLPTAGSWGDAICERVVATLRREVFDQMMVFNERRLSKILTEYTGHYNDHRPHQSRDQRPPSVETMVARPITSLADVRSVRRQHVLSGLVNQYHRVA
jgi:hypothetical protein